MKIFVFEPCGVRTGTGVNTSERFNTIMNQLAGYSPTELRLNDISSDQIKAKWLEKNDNSGTIIIAHYSDVEHYFNELETVNNAICLFHTYKTTWYKDVIKSDVDVKRIENNKNRFCCDSVSIKQTVKSFVDDFVQSKKPNPEMLVGYDSALDTFLKPFENTLPLDESWKGTKLQSAKEKLLIEVNKKLKQ